MADFIFYRMMFGTSGVRGQFGEEITPELAIKLGRAVAQTDISTAVIGRDSRTTGPILSDAVTVGLRERGIDVVNIGQVATPTLARSVRWYDGDVGIMITGSHNPPTDNGIKLWNPSGMAFTETQQKQVTTLFETSSDLDNTLSWQTVGTSTSHKDASQRHLNQLINESEQINADLSVVVDIGNGMGGVTVKALQAIGCSVQTLNAVPDGHFPGRAPEPTPESCSTLQEFVAVTEADLGIAHDGDADRMLAVDDEGQFITGDQLLALFAQESVGVGDKIAVPINTSLVVDDIVAEQGGTIERTKVGDVYVAEQVDQPGYVFGGEPSGSWIWPDYTLCPDGPLAAIKLAHMVSKRGPFSSLVERLPDYPILRDSYEVEQKAAVMNKVRDNLEGYSEVNTTDGVRVDTDEGWFLIRPSGTEQVIRLTVQGRSKEKTDQLWDTARQLMNCL